MKKKIQQKEIEQTFKSGEVMSMLEQINDGVELVSEQHGEIVSRLDSLESKFDKMQDDLDIVKIDVTKIKHDLKRKVDYDDFEKLEKRFLKVERLVFAKLT